MHRLRNQRSFVLSLLILSLGLCSATRSAENAAAAEARLKESVSYLASDALEGRGVGTQGLDKAADYIAAHFKQLGLRTDLFGGSPFQQFDVTIATEMGPADHNRLVLAGTLRNRAPTALALKLGESFTPLAISSSSRFDAPLVFAGYGITAKNLKRGDETFTYDDYANVDVKGKAVILIRKEPQQKDDKSPFDGKRASQYATFARKISNAAEHGAVAVILVNDQAELESRHEEHKKVLTTALGKLGELREKLAAAQSTDESFAKLASEISETAGEAAKAAASLASTSDVLLPFTGAGEVSNSRRLPVYFCTRAAIDEVMQIATRKDLSSIEREIDSDLVPRSVELTAWTAAGETRVIEKKASVKNVAAVLEGEGPLSDQTIVIGAHYDHLGLGGEGSLAPWTKDIHNGADDNASGTAVLLEVAHRLATAPTKPRRRIVFIAFTGEERGLLGSAHYVREPRFPLESTIAMLNLDMVGRMHDNQLAVYGTGTAKEFDPLVERLCSEEHFKITKHAGGFGPSDHSSFYSKKIPVLHLFTGTHSDYHRPSDDADKLNIEGMRRIADLMTDIVIAIDASSERPTYVEIRRVEQISVSNDAGDRPSFGSMPAYPNPVKDGVLLEAVLDGSPAEKAGVKGGDVLLKLGDDKITVLEDFEAALRQHKPGDRVKVTVRRGDQTIDTEVTLGRRRPMP